MILANGYTVIVWKTSDVDTMKINGDAGLEKDFIEHSIAVHSKGMTHEDFDEGAPSYSYLMLLYYLHSTSLGCRRIYASSIFIVPSSERSISALYLTIGITLPSTLRRALRISKRPLSIWGSYSYLVQYFANRSFIAKQVGNVRDVGASASWTFNDRMPITLEGGIFNGSGLTNQKHFWTNNYNFSFHIVIPSEEWYGSQTLFQRKPICGKCVNRIYRRERAVGIVLAEIFRLDSPFLILCHKVTTKKWNAERYSDRIELQGFQSCFRGSRYAANA